MRLKDNLKIGLITEEPEFGFLEDLTAEMIQMLVSAPILSRGAEFQSPDNDE